jgi:hypothetical protein
MDDNDRADLKFKSAIEAAVPPLRAALDAARDLVGDEEFFEDMHTLGSAMWGAAMLSPAGREVLGAVVHALMDLTDKDQPEPEYEAEARAEH